VNVKGDKMTSVEFEKLILQYSADIDYKVHAAYKKIKKPTHLDIEDVRSEVVAECWRAFVRWYHPEKSKPRTFMNRCITTTLTDIIWHSWKEVKTKSIFSEHGEDSFVLDIPSCDDFNFQDFELPKHLNDQERKYITIMLTHPSVKQKQVRAAAREQLSLSIEVEKRIRATIQEKFQENKNAAL
jgi:hypothetical protein